jgi:hypothetical protein
LTLVRHGAALVAGFLIAALVVARPSPEQGERQHG